MSLTPNRAASASPDSVIAYTHTLINTGNATDTFDLSHHSLQGWPVQYPMPIALSAGQTATVLISVTVPNGVVSGTLEVTTITATTRSSLNLSAAVTDTTLILVNRNAYLPLIMK